MRSGHHAAEPDEHRGGAGGKEVYTPIQVPETARISRDKQQIRLEDLKSEEVVAVQFEMKDGPELVLNTDYDHSPIPVPDGVGNKSHPTVRLAH